MEMNLGITSRSEAELTTITESLSCRIASRMRTMAIILLVAVLLLGSCGGCGEEKLADTSSPGNKYVATVFRRGCGATTGFLYHVNIRSSASSFSSDHRGVIEDGQVFLTREGKIKIAWKDEKTLLIDCEGCPTDRKPTMQNAWKDISISYRLY